jgi:hypothetical protein
MFKPIIITASEAQPLPDVHIFTLGDQDFFMPAVISGGIVLEMLEIAAEDGELAAAFWVMKTVLGDGYRALKESPDVTSDQIKQIAQIVSEHATGSLGK